jgi:hypothetical protein
MTKYSKLQNIQKDVSFKSLKIVEFGSARNFNGGGTSKSNF